MIWCQYRASDGIKNCCYHIALKISQRSFEFVGRVQSTWKPLVTNYDALVDYIQCLCVTLRRLWNVTNSIIPTPLPLPASASCRPIPVFTSKLWNITAGVSLHMIYVHCFKVEKKKALPFLLFDIRLGGLHCHTVRVSCCLCTYEYITPTSNA
jgi:hypothetical protein